LLQIGKGFEDCAMFVAFIYDGTRTCLIVPEPGQGCLLLQMGQGFLAGVNVKDNLAFPPCAGAVP